MTLLLCASLRTVYLLTKLRVFQIFLARLSAAGLRQRRWAGRYGVPRVFPPSVKIGVKQLLLCCHNISQCHPGCVNINQVRPVHYKRLTIIIHQRAETRRGPPYWHILIINILCKITPFLSDCRLNCAGPAETAFGKRATIRRFVEGDVCDEISTSVVCVAGVPLPTRVT